MTTNEMAFWMVWALCGVANFNAYVDSPNRSVSGTGLARRLRLAAHLSLCIALGPITTIIGIFIRTCSLFIVGKWAVPKSPETIAQSHNAGDGNER